MARICFVIIVLSSHLFMSLCQEDNDSIPEETAPTSTYYDTNQRSPGYSFGYGVTDAETGDMKTAWEAKEGDTVKGHYSVLEPDGNVRTVDYTANAKTGFKATVKNEGANSKPLTIDENQHPVNDDPLSENNQLTNEATQTSMEKKSLREYGKFDPVFEHSDYPTMFGSEPKHYKSKNPFETDFSAISQSIYRDYFKNDPEESAAYDSYYNKGHIYPPHDSKYKSTKREYNTKNKYNKIVEIDLTKPDKYSDNMKIRDASPTFESSSHKYFNDHSNIDLQKLVSPFSINGDFKIPKLFESSIKPFGTSGKHRPGKYEPYDSYPELFEYTAASELATAFPDMPIDTPKSKKKPGKKNKYPELFHYSNSDIEDDYVLVPKKKYKIHSKLVNPTYDLHDAIEDDYEKHRDHDENCNHNKNKEVIVKKYITKKPKPVINLLDLFEFLE